ncbi:hypothetical protein [Actinopolymorpha pittospori]|uniref:Uncharacterized protein n=1 Tax=Actinopolymorpha pittospori TaxID=648752 RepID=A0A927R9G0_9ACTN|nr:hypothetical protein [Actinopolymorpha pittospori]MBE1603945.1 hypothetical protein [Actinopolymorpha pittospori]
MLLGTGTGSFGAATNFAVGVSPFAVTMGTFERANDDDWRTLDFDGARVNP